MNRLFLPLFVVLILIYGCKAVLPQFVEETRLGESGRAIIIYKSSAGRCIVRELDKDKASRDFLARSQNWFQGIAQVNDGEYRSNQRVHLVNFADKNDRSYSVLWSEEEPKYYFGFEWASGYEDNEKAMEKFYLEITGTRLLTNNMKQIEKSKDVAVYVSGHQDPVFHSSRFVNLELVGGAAPSMHLATLLDVKTRREYMTTLVGKDFPPSTHAIGDTGIFFRGTRESPTEVFFKLKGGAILKIVSNSVKNGEGLPVSEDLIKELLQTGNGAR